MPSEVIFGNAAVDGSSRWGWFIGKPNSPPFSEMDLLKSS